MMKTRLIEALRTVGLGDPAKLGYCWGGWCTCNCGLLARELLGLDAKGLIDKWCSGVMPTFHGRGGPWTSAGAGPVCKTTGLPEATIIKELVEAGLEPADFGHLENLSNPAVLARLGVAYMERDEWPNASRYMLAWADLLEEADTASMEAYETRPLLLPVQQKAQPPSLEAGPTMNSQTTVVLAAQQP